MPGLVLGAEDEQARCRHHSLVASIRMGWEWWEIISKYINVRW